MNSFFTLFKSKLSYFNSTSKNVYRSIWFRIYSILIVLLAGVFPINAVGEGTNELCATDTDETYLYLCNDFDDHCGGGGGDRTNFAVYRCSDEDRLNFVINSTDEVV